MMPAREVVATATAALRGNWMRSVLTALGVIIGIAAVIVMLSIGEGTQRELDKLMSSLGANRLEVQGGAGRQGPASQGAGSRWSLTVGDFEAIRQQFPEIQYAAASLRGNAQLVVGESNWPSSWQGVTADWFAINGWTLAAGTGFEDRDFSGATKQAILGETVRQQLFGDADPTGETVRIGRVPFVVAGVLAPKGQGGFGQDQDDVVVVPLETGRRRLMGNSNAPPDAVQAISIGLARAEDLDSVQGEVEALLRERHRIGAGDEDDFSVRNLTQLVSTRTETTRLMSLLLGAVAFVSLVVGGIGIMNIMLVSVTERIREIGLRMAVGAGPRDIRRQFLAEAMLLSLGGGVLGIALGVGGALLAAKYGSLPAALSLRIVALATGFAVVTGLFFGYYPARKASQLDPIEALRQTG
jgi:putative ABC transport system permease protein